VPARPVASAAAPVGIGRRDVLTAGVGAALVLAALTEDASAAAAAKSGLALCLMCRGLFAGQGTKSVGGSAAGGDPRDRAHRS
jgi:hypothetical protein